MINKFVCLTLNQKR